MVRNSFLCYDVNTMLSKLNRFDRIELIKELNAFLLIYRDTLNLPSLASFGTEIEYKGANPLLVDFYVNEMMRDWNSSIDWESKREPSLPGGGEVTSSILYDNRKCWMELKNFCQFLKNNGADPLVSTGGHVHVGANILGEDYHHWRKFIKLYTIFEPILYRFGYGDKINFREKIKLFAKPVGEILLSKMWRFEYAKSLEEIVRSFPNDTRGYGLNLTHVKVNNMQEANGNTIEFRFNNATIEEVIWQNYINILVKLLLAARNPNLDEDYLDYLLKKQEQLSYTFASEKESFYRYQTILFDEALLFADIVFDNNLDKAYFLKQYFKNFQSCQEAEPLKLARRFIK